VLQRMAHGAEQLLEHRERELHAGLTRRGSRRVERGEMAQGRPRGIPVQNLDTKHLQRGPGIEQALSPPRGDRMTRCQDGCGGKLGGPLLLQWFDDLGACRRHWGAPLGVHERRTPHTAERHGGQEGEEIARRTSMNKSSYA